METQTPAPALMMAMTTEHFVLQTAANGTVSEAAARSTLYVMALSSSLVAMGFIAQTAGLLFPFSAIVFPAVFVLGLFTVSRLVDTSIEYRQCLVGIARVRGFYRSLGPEAAGHFATENGRWPETKPPAAQSGPFLAFLSTAASMIAVINNTLAGAAVGLLVHARMDHPSVWVAVGVGAFITAALTRVFMKYQHHRFRAFENQDPDEVTRVTD
jgi:hypothetical protein